MRLLRELTKLRAEEREAMSRLEARLAALLGERGERGSKPPSPPSSAQQQADRRRPLPISADLRRSSPNTTSAQAGDPSAERRSSAEPRADKDNTRAASRRSSPVLELTSADESSGRASPGALHRSGAAGRSTKSVARDGHELQPEHNVGRRRSAGDGPSPGTRKSSVLASSAGDKADAWKKAVPSCGVASAAKAERKHSIRAAQEIGISPPASRDASLRVSPTPAHADRVSPTTDTTTYGDLAC